MRKLLSLVIVLWAVSLGLVRAYSMRLDARPLPMELQNTSQDLEEICINHQCEAEQD